jgi:hypothetical protein
VRKVTPSLHSLQTETLWHLVWGCLLARKGSLAAIGRRMLPTTVVKHRIKRVDRFLKNQRVEVSEAMRGTVGWFLRQSGKRFVVAIDWVDIRSFMVLTLAATFHGRAIPLLWTTCTKWKFRKSQNDLEEGLLRLFHTMVADPGQIVLIADRGFGRAELARTLQELGFHYVIRFQSKVTIQCPQYTGKLNELPVSRGTSRMLRNVLYRKYKPVEQNVVVYWQYGQKEPWFLMTDLDCRPEDVAQIYGRRMKIEQVFRDEKNMRYGFSLRQVRVKDPSRLQRLLLLIAMAYIFLVAVGFLSQKKLSPRHWSSSSKPRQCSLFLIGVAMLSEVDFPLLILMNSLKHALVRDQP